MQQLWLDLVIDLQHGRVHDGHVETCLDGMVQESRMHGLAHSIVASERKRKVGHSSGSQSSRQVRLDPSHRLDEIHCISRVFLNPGSDGKYVHVEYYIFRRHSSFLSQKPVCPFAYFDLSIICGCLTLLVEGHDHHSRSQLSDLPGLCHEGLRTLLQTDGIHDALSLCVLQTGKNRLPVRRINHQGSLCHSRVIGYASDESFHLPCAVQHSVVHVYVYDRGPVLDLLCGNLQRLVIFSGSYESGELTGARHIGPLTDICEVVLPKVHPDCLQTAHRQAPVRGIALFCGQFMRLETRNSLGDGSNMLRSRSAAPSYDIHKPFLRKSDHCFCHLRRSLVISAHLIRKSGIRVAAHHALAPAGYIFQKRSHFSGSQRAVQTESQERVVLHGGVECL